MPTTRRQRPSMRRGAPGGQPGQLQPIASAKPYLTLTRYDHQRLEIHHPGDLAALGPLLDWPGVIWLDVRGLGDIHLLAQLGERLHLHPLALEDVTHTPQRPKVDVYEENLFIICRMLELRDGLLSAEQLNLFLGAKTLVTFHEVEADPFGPVRERLERQHGQLRQGGADHLAYALIDLVVDRYFPVLEAYGERLEQLEARILEHASPEHLAELHQVRRDLLLIRRVLWPLRDVIQSLLRDESPFITPSVRTFLRDVSDHAFQVLDILENDREVLASLTDLYLSTTSYRLNEIMKVLTILSTVFIPLTFLVGVYGMNFDHMPELHWRFGYLALWLVMILVASGEVLYFHRRGWL